MNSAPWAIAFSSTAQARSKFQAWACRQLSSLKIASTKETKAKCFCYNLITHTTERPTAVFRNSKRVAATNGKHKMIID